ncbi:MAG: type II toxin-antitoxin system RelE/ParE family toxin [Magnetococcales bacterium]|nr:type II toxin-antitoxin system RelE/ParE family toxin [Magnetococcales bacterium]
MKIIETSLFARQIQALMADDDDRLLQAALILRPELGDLIQNSGGIRNVRWSLPGQGKRGGSRIIYFWAVTDDTILMLLVYPKSAQQELTPTQLRALRKIVEEEFDHG